MRAIWPRPHRSPASLLVGLLLAMVAVVATSCGVISAITDTQSALEDEGFDNVSVSFQDTNGRTTVEVDADQPSDTDSTSDAQKQAAEVVWTEFPRRLDSVDVTIDGDGERFSRSELEDMFGDRPDGLDDKDITDDARNIGIGVVIALGVGALLCIGLIVLIIVLVSRSRKKKRAQQQQFGPPQGYGGPPPGGGFPPPGQPPGGYQPQGPPQDQQPGSSF